MGEVVDVKSWTVYIRALAGLGQCAGRAGAILAQVRNDGVIPDKTMLKTLQTVLKGQDDEHGAQLVEEQLVALGSSRHRRHGAARGCCDFIKCWAPPVGGGRHEDKKCYPM